jgi:intein-encoded DNA endonuclease-like protein
MAYVLGFIYADGNIDNSKKILSISQKEPEILHKILKLMDSNAKINVGKYGVHSIKIVNKKITSDLSKIGLTPNKSLSINFPDIPPGYARHFIRGCWDGDGSIHISGRGLYNIRASYVSGSLNFIKGMLREFEKAGFPPLVIHKSKGKVPHYSFYYTGIKCEQLFRYLYDDVPPTLYLSRKYEIFFDYFGHTA